MTPHQTRRPADPPRRTVNSATDRRHASAWHALAADDAAALRPPLVFGALATSIAAVDLFGPIAGLTVGLLLLHAAAGQPLTPWQGAAATGALASLTWLIFR